MDKTEIEIGNMNTEEMLDHHIPVIDIDQINPVIGENKHGSGN